jgi:hypothetical protein
MEELFAHVIVESFTHFGWISAFTFLKLKDLMKFQSNEELQSFFQL